MLTFEIGLCWTDVSRFHDAGKCVCAGVRLSPIENLERCLQWQQR